MAEERCTPGGSFASYGDLFGGLAMDWPWILVIVLGHRVGFRVDSW